MSINGNGDTLTIKGAKLKVSGGVQVSGSIAYTEDATGFGGVTAVIDTNNNNTRLNITAGKTSGVAKIERATVATITAINHTNVSNNTTIHIALKNTSSNESDFVTLGLFANDDTVKVNYTDEYVISPGETGMITVRKVAGVLSMFVREMFSSTATDFDTANKPFYIKDGTNYKYPLYKSPGGNLEGDVTIGGVTYYRPDSGLKTKTRPPLGIPELIISPSGNLAIGNNGTGTTVNYDVWGVPSSFDFGSIYQGSTKKTSFILENGEASGSFTESGASSGDAYSLYVERTDTSSSDTVSQTSGGWTGVVAFHHGTFANSGDPYGDGTLAGATANNHVFADTQTGTYTWGTLTANTTTNSNTTYTWTPPNDIVNAQIVLVAGGGGGGSSYQGGGGGAGGYNNLTGQYIENSNTIIVGNGGNGYISGGVITNAVNGENSYFGSTYVLGGGSGASESAYPANIGGSGGGGTHTQHTGASGTSGQGNAGGDGLTEADNWAGGGGGGAGGVGGNASSSAAGTGGTGVTNDILGTSIEFAKGGDGGRRPQNSNGTAGTKHRGNGGNGGGGSPLYNGGQGGSGIVIVKSNDGTVGKKIPKVTGASFDSTNVTFTVQDASNITNIKYTINGGSEQTTPVGTLAVAHNLSASASITVIAWAVDANGVQISTKKTVTGTIP